MSKIEEIHGATGISKEALLGKPLCHFSISERLSWAKHRETRRAEDAAYSLQGLFDVHIVLLYAEGRDSAMK